MPATNETARNINRSIVLKLIRDRQPVSQAELARLSGLRPSTVSAIVEQLIGEAWVVKGNATLRPRGRRPTELRLNERRAIAGVDIRPGNTTVAVADINGTFASQEVFATARQPETTLREIAAAIVRLRRRHRGLVFDGVGVSLPGRVDPQTHRLVFAPNLKWPECDLSGPLAKATRLDVALENAANACALAEVWFGRHAGDMVVVTVSEGIGTAVFANGRVVRGADGMAGEFGHSTFDPKGPPCACGNRGCWEVFASNTAALRYYGYEPGFGFQDLLDLAQRHDVRAGCALTQQAQHLARGAAMLTAGLSPERLVFVGELTRAWNWFGPVIEHELRGRRVSVVAAGDGCAARLRGTIALVLEKHFGVPDYL